MHPGGNCPQSAVAQFFAPSLKPKMIVAGLKAIAWALVIGLAIFFVAHYVFRYYLNYNEAAFTNVALSGEPNFWVMRGWLLLHISSGTVALFVGPLQFWTGLRRTHIRLHRWTGRVFLVCVAAGSTCAIRLAIATALGWAVGVALFVLATAWITTASMACYAIRTRRIQIHKEWMIRAYVMTFAFVTFRLLADYLPTSRLQPDGDRTVTMIWLSWTVPLLITETVLQLRRMEPPVVRQSKDRAAGLKMS